MDKEEIERMREDLLNIPHGRLVEICIKLKTGYINACKRLEKLEEDLDKLQDSEECLNSLMDSLQD